MLTVTFRYRIYPSLEQETRLLNWLETCRRAYNYAVGERKDWIASRKCRIDRCSLQREYIMAADAKYPGFYDQKKALTQAKKHSEYLRDVHSQVLQDVMARVDAAFNFCRDRGFGFPRFKKVGQFKSVLFPQVKNAIRGEQIAIPKIGLMPIVLHRPIPDSFAVKTVRVIRRHSGWYASLVLVADVDVPDVAPSGYSIGIDVGLEYFLSASDGLQVERPRFLNKLQSKLKLLQRRLKRKQKRSNRRAKLIKRIGRVHEQIAACRLDWHFKLAHKLCDRANIIFVEDLDFRTLAKGMLGKHMLDAGLGQFVNQVLPWVCWKRGVYYGKVDPRGTSQTCPDCGARVSKQLSDRINQCPECGSVKPRDIAAAQVINARGLSGVQIAQGWDLSGALPRQDRVNCESPERKSGKPALYL